MCRFLTNLKLLLFLLTCWLLFVSLTEQQVVKLRHPETDSESHSLLKPKHGKDKSSKGKFKPKPGTVIVRLNRNHDIQKLQYVLQDGRLANLYHIHGQPIQVKGKSSMQQEKLIGYPETGKQIKPELEHIVQLHHGSETMQPHNDIFSTNGDFDIFATLPDEDHQHSSEPNHQSKDDKKAKKPKILLDKLKKKVSEKFHQLPEKVKSKLKSKSSESNSKLYLDKFKKKDFHVDTADNQSPDEAIDVEEVPDVIVVEQQQQQVEVFDINKASNEHKPIGMPSN